MKPKHTLKNRNYQPTTLRLYESMLIKLASRFCSAWRCLLQLVKMLLQNLKDTVHQNLQTTQAVRAQLSQSLTSRHCVGIVLTVVGIVSLFAHLFFDPYEVDHQVCRVLGFEQSQCWNGLPGELSKGWCYTGWFDYIGQIRFYVALLFWSVALVLIVPPKYTFSFVLAVIFHAVGWSWIIHYSFFSTSHKTINSFPAWQVCVLVLAFAVGLMQSIRPLLYWENHKKRGNWQRWPSIYRSPLSQEEKNRLYAMADKEYQEINKMI